MIEYIINLQFFLITIFIIYFIGYKISKNLFLNIKIYNYIFIWHYFITLVYIYFVNNNGGDQLYYYYKFDSFDEFSNTIETNKNIFYPGRNIIVLINIFLKYYLSASYISVVFIFSSFGLYSLLFFYYICKNIVSKNILSDEYNYLILFLVFIPSFSFWTSGIGKDSISCFTIIFSIYAVYTKKNEFIKILFSCFLVFLFRPHISFIIIFAYYISCFLYYKNNNFIKIFALSIPLFIFYTLVIGITGFDDKNYSIFSITNLFNFGNELYLRNYSEISSNTIFNSRIFNFLFEPLFYNTDNLFKFIISFENMILIFIFLYLILNINYFKIYANDYNIYFVLIISIILLTVLSITSTSNLGIATRIKWMVLPAILILLFSIQNKKYEK